MHLEYGALVACAGEIIADVINLKIVLLLAVGSFTLKIRHGCFASAIPERCSSSVCGTMRRPSSRDLDDQQMHIGSKVTC